MSADLRMPQQHKLIVSLNYMMVLPQKGVHFLYLNQRYYLLLKNQSFQIRKSLHRQCIHLRLLCQIQKHWFVLSLHRLSLNTPIVLGIITQIDISLFLLETIHFIYFSWFPIFKEPYIARYNIAFIGNNTFFAYRAGA